jgi:glutathione S-transferase
LLCLQFVLYESEVINEWLEEQFPQPPLLPVHPLQRSQVRWHVCAAAAAAAAAVFSIVAQPGVVVWQGDVYALSQHWPTWCKLSQRFVSEDIK